MNTSTNSTKDQARTMASMGCTANVIAKRLGITHRHIRRLTQGITLWKNTLIDTDQEPRLWLAWYQVDGSYRKTAWRFGVSHETVRKALKTDNTVSSSLSAEAKAQAGAPEGSREPATNN